MMPATVQDHWDELNVIWEKINLMLQKIAPTPENKEIREELINAKAHIVRAQYYT